MQKTWQSNQTLMDFWLEELPSFQLNSLKSLILNQNIKLYSFSFQFNAKGKTGKNTNDIHKFINLNFNIQNKNKLLTFFLIGLQPIRDMWCPSRIGRSTCPSGVINHQIDRFEFRNDSLLLVFCSILFDELNAKRNKSQSPSTIMTTLKSGVESMKYIDNWFLWKWELNNFSGFLVFSFNAKFVVFDRNLSAIVMQWETKVSMCKELFFQSKKGKKNLLNKEFNPKMMKLCLWNEISFFFFFYFFLKIENDWIIERDLPHPKMICYPNLNRMKNKHQMFCQSIFHAILLF